MAAAGTPDEPPYRFTELYDTPAGLQHPVLQRLYAYWLERRGDRMAPARADIDPVDFRYALGWVNLAEVRPGSDHFEFRVFGTSLARVMDLAAPMADRQGVGEGKRWLVDGKSGGCP